MSSKRLVATATLAAFLSAVTASASSAQTQAPQPSPLRASIDRAASKTAQSPTLPQRRPAPVRKAMQGGGGGSGAMVMGLIATAAGLAATYFVIKEMNKQTEALTTPPQ